MVIIGAGLGACVFAQALSSSFKIALLDRDHKEIPSIEDCGHPAGIDIIFAYGKGGTTRYWHNGLIKIPKYIFEQKWPFSRAELEVYYRNAIKIFGGVDLDLVNNCYNKILLFYKSIGLTQDIIGEGLFYPSRRINASKLLVDKDNIRYINGDIVSFEMSHAIENEIKSVTVKTRDGIKKIFGKYFIISSGGLNTPLILNKLILRNSIKTGIAKPGEFYEDHPTAFVLRFKTNKKLYKYWNKSIGFGIGNVRVPLNLVVNGISVAFYIRPSYKNTNSAKSSLSEIRNRPWRIKNYINLFMNLDDIIEAISFKTGITLPTRNYTILMVAGQSSCSGGVISSDADGAILRNWKLSSQYLETLDNSIKILIDSISCFASDFEILDWKNEIQSSAHHSSTAKMGLTAHDAVCNLNGKVFDFKNLYINDGSAIPSSGYSNTGLTIAALALRMADLFNKIKK